MKQSWPSLKYEEWKDTYQTLHMWSQIVGKIRLTLSPWTNHSWHVTLYVTARGLTTSPIPFGPRLFQIEFDFVDHVLRKIVALIDVDLVDGERRRRRHVRLERRTTGDERRSKKQQSDSTGPVRCHGIQWASNGQMVIIAFAIGHRFCAGPDP